MLFNDDGVVNKGDLAVVIGHDYYFDRKSQIRVR
jgi:hypothetical protein